MAKVNNSHIQETYGLPSIRGNATKLYEDNVACIDQIKGGFIKGDKTKHISPKFFYNHKLQEKGEIDIQKIQSCNNLADPFTKALPLTTFKRLMHNIEMRIYRDLRIEKLKKSLSGLQKGEKTNMDILHTFFLRPSFVPLGFTNKVFNKLVTIFL